MSLYLDMEKCNQKYKIPCKWYTEMCSDSKEASEQPYNKFALC